MGIIWFGAERTISRYADDMLLYISDPTYLDTVSYVLNLGDGEFQTSPTSHSLSLSFSLNVYRHCRSTRMTIRLDVSAEATCLFFFCPFTRSHPHLHSSPLSLSAASSVFPSHHLRMTPSSITLSAHIHTLRTTLLSLQNSHDGPQSIRTDFQSKRVCVCERKPLEVSAID